MYPARLDPYSLKTDNHIFFCPYMLCPPGVCPSKINPGNFKSARGAIAPAAAQ